MSIDFECKGNCEEHAGVVRLVKVWDSRNGFTWGIFPYCAKACLSDRAEGLTVIGYGINDEDIPLIAPGFFVESRKKYLDERLQAERERLSRDWSGFDSVNPGSLPR